MSEVTKEHYAEVTHYNCPVCEQPCVWTKGAKNATFDEKIQSLTFDHKCNCEDKIHDLDKIYPIVHIGREVSNIIMPH